MGIKSSTKFSKVEFPGFFYIVGGFVIFSKLWVKVFLSLDSVDYPLNPRNEINGPKPTFWKFSNKESNKFGYKIKIDSILNCKH